MQKYERYQTFYGFANLIPFLPKDQRRLRNNGNVISENRKLKTEPVTGHILVSLGNLVRTVPISTLRRSPPLIYHKERDINRNSSICLIY
jgi:hypothetical protein